MYRKKLAMLFAEAMGAGVLTWVALVASLTLGLPYFTAAGVATALALLILLIGNASGAHANPAVTLGFWSIRKIPTLQAVAYIAAQLVGAYGAARLFAYFSNRAVADIADKEFAWRLIIAEAVGAFVFTFGVAAAVYQGYKGLRLAVTVGASLFIGILVAAVAGNGIVNPAVAVGLNSISWSYLAGPLVGGLVGMNLYAMLFADTTKPVRVETTVRSAPAATRSATKKPAVRRKK